MSDTTAMLPCPFCGGPVTVHNYVTEACVRCHSCRAAITRPHPAGNDAGLPKAIYAWNRRTTEQPPVHDDLRFASWHDAKYPEPEIYHHRVAWRTDRAERRNVWNAAIAALAGQADAPALHDDPRARHVEVLRDIQNEYRALDNTHHQVLAIDEAITALSTTPASGGGKADALEAVVVGEVAGGDPRSDGKHMLYVTSNQPPVIGMRLFTTPPAAIPVDALLALQRYDFIRMTDDADIVKDKAGGFIRYDELTALIAPASIGAEAQEGKS